MEGVFPFGVLIGRRENIVFECSFVHLRSCQSHGEVKDSGV